MFAKKEDVVSLLSSGQPSTESAKFTKEELDVLKKLDTIRYPSRTEQRVENLLNESEKKILSSLIAKKAVVLYNDEKRKEKLYSISKHVYDTFLLRKRPKEKEEIDQARAWGEVEPTLLRVKPGIENENVKALESKGYVVLPTEAEAAALSMAVSESIRQGQVIGTRAFNKKYYIFIKSFFDKLGNELVKQLKSGPKKVSELASQLHQDEEAIRGTLYLLAEQGDVTENRKDVFALVE